jgi:hypothetical protein
MPVKLVLIHGISQEGSSAETLLENWCRLISDREPGMLRGVEVQMAYFGDELARWTAKGVGGTMVPMGLDVGDTEEMKFVVAALEQVASERNIPAAVIEKEIKAVPMGSWIGQKLVGLVRGLESASPLKGGLALRVIKQAYTYLANEHAREAVDALVRPLLVGERLVVVSHSLGTVVAFRLLREISKAAVKPPKVPLLITMGSPLGLDAVKAKLQPPRVRPACVERWVNFYDPSDFVALGKDLDKNTFADGIENVGDVDNVTPNAHGISGYLPEPRVLSALRNALA